MPRHQELVPRSPWVQLETGADDWKSLDADVLLSMFGRMQIRSFEEYVLELAGDSLVHGPAYSSTGREGGAVGSILTLRTDDFVNGSHRGHHQFLADHSTTTPEPPRRSSNGNVRRHAPRRDHRS